MRVEAVMQRLDKDKRYAGLLADYFNHRYQWCHLIMFIIIVHLMCDPSHCRAKVEADYARDMSKIATKMELLEAEHDRPVCHSSSSILSLSL